MSARLCRTVVALTLAPWLVLASTMPPEHLHEADEHHSHAVTHRHFGAHGHDATEIERGEGRVVWLDSGLALAHAPSQLIVPDTIVPAHFQTLPDVNGWIVESILDARPSHGPPRPSTSPRAPPSLSA